MEDKRSSAMLSTIVDELEGEDEDELALMSSNNFDEFSGDNNAEANQRLNGAGQLAAQSKRKEKARIAARARRSQEATIIMEMAAELQITQDKMRRIDKATIVKLAIDYIRAHDILCHPTRNDQEEALQSKNSMIEQQQQQQQLVDDDKLTQENEEEEQEEEEKVLDDEEKSILMSCVKCGERAEPATMRSTMGEIDSNCGADKNITRLLSTCCASLMTVANENNEEQQDEDGGIFSEKQIEASNQKYEEEEEEEANDDENNLGNEFKENNNNNNELYQEERHKQSLYSAPKLSTASIFAPKTDDNMNSYFLMIEEKANGKSEFILKPDTEIHDDDDLTHLAPQAGGISISFETDPLDGIPIDDLLIPSPLAATNHGEQRYQNSNNNITINVQNETDELLDVANNFNVVHRRTNNCSSSSSSPLMTSHTPHYNKGAPPMAIPIARPRVNSGCHCVGGPPASTLTKSQYSSMIKNCIPSFTSATHNSYARRHHVNDMPIKPSRVSGSTSPPMKKLHWATSLDDNDYDDDSGGTAEGQLRQDEEEGVNEEDNIIRYHQYHQQKAHNHNHEHPIENTNNQCNRRRHFESLYHNSNSHTQFANSTNVVQIVNNHQYRPVNFVHQQQQQQLLQLQRLI